MAGESNDKLFIPVRLNTLRGDELVDFDVFIRIGEKQVHYIRKNDPIEESRIEALRSKGVRKLFIPIEHEPSYLSYLDSGLGKLQNKELTVEARTEVATASLMNISGHAERAIENEKRYRDMEGRVQKVLSFVNSEKGIAGKMLRQSGFAEDELQHASNVTTLSLMLASKVKLDSKEMANLTIAGLVHDIGKIGLPIDPTLSMENMVGKELELYKSHPRLGAEKLAGKSYINPSIVSLVLNHEERGNGAGFPEKKRIQSLPLAQQILNLCNEYDRMCSIQKIPPVQAMKRFFVDKLGLFPLELVQALGEALKIE